MNYALLAASVVFAIIAAVSAESICLVNLRDSVALRIYATLPAALSVACLVAALVLS